MGVYATTTSLSVLLVNFLKTNTTTADTFGTSLFEKAITKSEAQVNAALASRYSMPFATVPPLVTDMAERLACYHALLSSNTQDGDGKNVYLDEFKTVFADLKAIVAGELKLTYTDGSIVPVNTSTRFLTSTPYTPIFGLDEATAWARDEDEIESQEDARA
jgi:phage gp36-like protein